LRAVPGLRSARITEDLTIMCSAARRHRSMTDLSDEIALAVRAMP
jgi:hypothetical protein